MNTVPAIVPVPFHGETIDAFQQDGKTWISLKRVCETLGIDESKQRRKLLEKPWAVADLRSATGSDGKQYHMTCVDLNTLPMWLATIDIGRVKPECRDKLKVYQCEAARVLAEHFLPKTKPIEPPVQVSLEEVPAIMRSLNFHGDIIYAFRSEDFIWVALKGICDTFGMDHEIQWRRFKKLPWAVTYLVPGVRADGKKYKTDCVEIETLRVWLTHIKPGLVYTEKLKLYQRNAANFIAGFFRTTSANSTEFAALSSAELHDQASVKAMDAIMEIWRDLKGRA